jgi:hypothetical protein
MRYQLSGNDLMVFRRLGKIVSWFLLIRCDHFKAVSGEPRANATIVIAIY